MTRPIKEQPPKLSWFEEYEQRAKERKRRHEERMRNRKPLPDDETIGSGFVESYLRYFATTKTQFWDDSCHRFGHCPSDFLGKLRLGDHRDSYGHIVDVCQKAVFPTLKFGHVKAIFSDKTKGSDPVPPDVSYHLNDSSEWPEARAEMCNFLGISHNEPAISKNAQLLVDLASRVPLGEEKALPKSSYSSWNVYDCENAVCEAQRMEPRLDIEGEAREDVRIIVAARPLPELVLPALNVSLDLPHEINKSECAKLSRQIEAFVQQQYQEGHLESEWLVLVRTTSRVQLKKSFGMCKDISEICSKLRPTGLYVWWSFPRGGSPWILAVRPEEAMDWPRVIEAIKNAAVAVCSAEKYGLSKEAGLLLDWLTCLRPSEFEWTLSPELTDEVRKVEIGLENPWEDENPFLFFHLLADEITRKTPYMAVAHRWRLRDEGSIRLEFRVR